MTRKLPLIVILASFGLFASTVQAAFITETEPNGTIATATLLQPDSADPTNANNVLGVTGGASTTDSDFFGFNLDLTNTVGGNDLRIKLDAVQNSRSIAFQLYDALGNTIGTEQTLSTNSSNQGIKQTDYNIPASGDYYVRVRATSGSSFSYELTVAGLNGSKVNVIPEPASLALMGLGGLLMLGRGTFRGGRGDA